MNSQRLTAHCPGARLLQRLVLAAGFLVLGTALAQVADDVTVTDLTAADVQSRVEQLQDSTAFDEETRTAALEFYRRALANLANAEGYSQLTDRYRDAVTTAPVGAEQIRAAVSERQEADPLSNLGVSPSTTAAEIDELLQREQGSEAVARAAASELRQELVIQQTRPQAARERRRLADEELRTTMDRSGQPETDEIPEIVREARRTARQSTTIALRAEIQMLDQEILSHPVRIALMQAQAEEAEQILEGHQARIRALQAALSERRRADTDRVLEELGLESLDADTLHPVIERVLIENRELADELNELTLAVEATTQANRAAEQQLEEMRQRYERARSRLEVAGIGQALGRYLAQERRELPGTGDYRRKISLREDQIAEESIRNISLGERLRGIRDVEDYVDRQLIPVPEEEASVIRPALLRLTESQSSVLQQMTRLHSSYLRLLAENSYTQSQLFEVNSEYRKFLAEHLMWVRSRGAFGWSDFVALPDELMAFASPKKWIDTATILANRLPYSPMLITALLALLVFYLYRPRLLARLRETSAKVGKPSEDSFVLTARAILLTSLMALPWPALMAAAGYEIANSPQADEATRAIGVGTYQVSSMLFALLWFRMLCVRGGVADSHFRWSREAVAAFRRQFDWLTLVLVVPAFVLVINSHDQDAITAGGLNQIMLAIAAGGLTIFLFRLLRPDTGVASRLRRRGASQPLVRNPRILIVFATLIPLVVGIMAMSGFMYSAGTLLRKLALSVLLLFAIGVVWELIVRWLLVFKRRLLLREALQRREAAAREASGEPPASDELTESEEDSPVEIASLDADTRKLVNISLVIATILGIAGIWSSVLPALGILDEITLWHHVVTVGDVDTLNPVTLIDLISAIIVVVITAASVRNLPSLIEIILRQSPSIKPGTRLAYSTLAQYTIAAIGIGVTLSIIGVNWSKLQWLIAALGVGIGFGLQEIVANLFSGLIILIERPVRVGDMVTVGDVSGTVSRIQIRATTIRTQDRTELLVPNKELIANRVLNWSLTDEILRLSIPVGIAYGSDVEQALRIIEEVANAHPDVLDDPEPLVVFDSFGDNALGLNLRCFVKDLQIRFETKTDINRQINRRFQEAGIVIAFPQRDLHLDTASPLEIRVLRDSPTET